jgi:toxin ParE1/3/4
MRIEKRDKALIDLDEFAAVLTRDAGPDVALRFLDSTEKTLERLAAMPASGGLYECDNPLLQGLRHASVRGFPNHYLFYFERLEGIELIRMLHAKRDLGRALAE